MRVTESVRVLKVGAHSAGTNWMTVMVGIKGHKSFPGSLDVINGGALGPFRFSDRVNALDSDVCEQPMLVDRSG